MARSSFVVVRATQDHVDSLKGRLRESDLAEIAAASGRAPDLVLQHSFEQSFISWAAIAPTSMPIAVAGVCSYSLLSEKGVPWMLGSKELAGAGLEVGRSSRHYIEEMNCRFPYLENWIDARQKKSIKWLEWCGFKIDPAQPFGVLGLPFHRFWRTNYV